ncbi:MAG: hypothetical protein M1825_002203 [Sarcosagium campestre]|nr:MAG: hypothetical protein M1825_002203 [Sarcosagium campestre]
MKFLQSPILLALLTLTPIALSQVVAPAPVVPANGAVAPKPAVAPVPKQPVVPANADTDTTSDAADDDAAPAVAPKPAAVAPVAPAKGAGAAAAPKVAPKVPAAPANPAPAAGVAAGGGVADPVAPPVNGQAPTVTQIDVPKKLANGQYTMIKTAYTQTFADIPSQGPEPKQGRIGLGTLTGQVGTTKTVEAYAIGGRDARRDGLAVGAVVGVANILLAL